jgi:hypothetical protein
MKRRYQRDDCTGILGKSITRYIPCSVEHSSWGKGISRADATAETRSRIRSFMFAVAKSCRASGGEVVDGANLETFVKVEEIVCKIIELLFG